MPDISRKMPENNGKITGDYEELPGNNGQSSGTCGEMPESPGETPVTDCRTNPDAEQSARPKSALIAMSGGVDSSVAAYIMKRDGYYCEGTTMRLYRNEDIGLGSFRTCCSQKDIEDAGEVAFRLDIPYEVLDLTVDFKKHIIDKFIRVYEAGGTPNPCIDCNRYMKFDMLLKVAEERGLSYVVTGHYARIQYDCERGLYLLRKAADPGKDQSYVLYMLGQEQLARIKFPLGDIPKDETRRIAAEQGFVNAEKHDSQDICFVPDGDYVGFMEQYTGKIDGFFKLFLKYRHQWQRIVSYLQRVSPTPREGTPSLFVDTPWQVKGDRGILTANAEALRDLAELGFLQELELQPEKQVRFSACAKRSIFSHGLIRMNKSLIDMLG